MIMIRFSTAILSAILLMLFATVQTNAATATWQSTSASKIEFGKPSLGTGPSYLRLQKQVTNKQRAASSSKNLYAKIVYFNDINRMKCFFVCKRTPTQYQTVVVRHNGKVIGRAAITVESTPNPNGDVFKLKVLSVAKGYKWIGRGTHVVCERCRFVARLVAIPQPTTDVPTPSPVPLPPAMALMFTGLFGLYGTRKLKKRR